MGSLRWPDGVTCPHCGSNLVAYLANQRRWQCRSKHPRRQFSVKVGTIFEDSPVGLDKWFTAIWLIAGAKNGISSYEIHRAIGVTQVDETFIGGKARNMHEDRRDKMRGRTFFGKAAVKTHTVPRDEADTLQRVTVSFLSPGDGASTTSQ